MVRIHLPPPFQKQRTSNEVLFLHWGRRSRRSRERCEAAWSRNIWFDSAKRCAWAKREQSISHHHLPIQPSVKTVFLCSNHLFYNNFSTLQKNGGRIGFAPQISHNLPTFAGKAPLPGQDKYSICYIFCKFISEKRQYFLLKKFFALFLSPRRDVGGVIFAAFFAFFKSWFSAKIFHF